MLVEMKMIRDQAVGEWEGGLKQARKTTAEYQSCIDEVGKQLFTSHNSFPFGSG